MRLALVCGLAEMLTVAAIRDATPDDGPVALCLYGAPIAMPDALRRQSLADANLFGPWAHVYDCVIDEPATVLSEIVPDTILTHTLGGALMAALFAQFPHASIDLFDNGLASHLDRPVVDNPTISRSEVPRPHLDRVVRAWLTLADQLPIPAHLAHTPLARVPGEKLHQVARAALVRMRPEDAPEPDQRPARLILGTAFYRSGAMAYDDERRLYRELVAHLKGSGDEPILYKEHPRASLEPLLSARDGIEVVASRMPVEVWAEARPIIESYSISSTALLTLQRFYGCRSRTIGSLMDMSKVLPQVALAHQAIEPFSP